MYLLSTDLHLTDRPEDAYRWAVLDEIAAHAYEYTGVYLLGDVWDRRDRHSAALVNRSVEILRAIAVRAPLTILRGNHDTTLREPSFWEFLNQLDAPIRYITRPKIDETPGGRLALLPFTATPKDDWRGVPFRLLTAAFMHATVPGAVTENGTVMDNPHFPLLPRRCRYFSGDVHLPQQCGAITYVGAPHPVRFGDDYACRMLVLDPQFEIAQDIRLTPPKKHMLDIRDLQDLRRIAVRAGDQVKIRLNGDAADAERWASAGAWIAAWAAEREVRVASTEIVLNSTAPGRFVSEDPAHEPEALLQAFARSEKLTEATTEAGLALLRDCA